MSTDDDLVPPVRASDREREGAVDRLREAAGEGRLTLEELADRSEAAYAAVSRADLDQLVADLPAGGAEVAEGSERSPAPGPVPVPVPAQRRSFWGILGGDTIQGPMRLSGECRIVNVLGGVDLDLSQAVLEGGELTLRIYSVLGGATVHVPRGVRVERSGFSLLGGDSIEPDDAPPPPGVPVLHVRSVNVMGGNDVKRGPRRTQGWPWQRHLGHDTPH